MLYSNVQEFEQTVKKDITPYSPKYKACWRCGSDAVRRDSMKCGHSKIIDLRLVNIILSREDPVYVCKDCQEEFYSYVLENTDLLTSENVLAREI